MSDEIGPVDKEALMDLVQTLVEQGRGTDIQKFLRRLSVDEVAVAREIANGDYKYWAFISYSHKDADWGDWVHRTLENYRVPSNLVGRETSSGVVPKRVFPIFRDREELGTASELTDEIEAALEASRFLVVICSVASAQSHWVGEEIKRFKSMYGSQRVLCIIVDGEPNAWDGSEECFPDAIRYEVTPEGELTNQPCEPIAADARPQGDGRFNAKLKLLAGLLGVKYDELRQREKIRRRRSIARTASAVAIALLIVGYVLHAQRKKNLVERVHTTVESLHTTRGIIQPPFVVLDQYPTDLIVAELKSQFESDADRKLPLAFAMAKYGDVRVVYLTSQVQNAPPNDAANFVDALERAKPAALEAIKSAANRLKGTETATLRHRARLAMLSLHLGESSLATEMCQSDGDPIERTVFIDECSAWSGDLIRLSQHASEIEDSTLRSALCLTVGGVSLKFVTMDEREVCANVLTDWHVNQPDTGTHSASGWALRNWGLPLPDTSESIQKQNKWRVSPVGLTMLTIPAGHVLNSEGKIVKARQDFLLSDREISVGLYQQFIDDISEDSKYPAVEKPLPWGGVRTRVSPTSEHPVQQVSWSDAVMFCNWLSRKEGLVPCYEWTGEQERDQAADASQSWRLVRIANGYRLPTVSEWEYACRAGTITAFSFGDDDEWLDRYGVFRSESAETCGSRIPNDWGFFDMHGNVAEYCDDAESPNRLLNDTSDRLSKGGFFNSPAGGCMSASWGWDNAKFRTPFNGFRVAIALSSQGAEAEAPKTTENRTTETKSTGKNSTQL